MNAQLSGTFSASPRRFKAITARGREIAIEKLANTRKSKRRRHAPGDRVEIGPGLRLDVGR